MVEYGAHTKKNEWLYPLARRWKHIYDADDPTRKHYCDPKVLHERLGALHTAAPEVAPAPTPAKKTPRKPAEKAQKRRETQARMD